jgi:peptide deformylase
VAAYRVRTFGDPVLRRKAQEVQRIDDRVAQLVSDMHVTMRQANGIGLAAPQVGVSRRLFVYEIGDSGPRALVNPVITAAEGEWEHEEGCLSVPGLYFPIARAKRVRVEGLGLDGAPVALEAEDMEAKLYQHEVEHLDGRLLIDLLDDDRRRAALREMRHQGTDQGARAGARRR